MSVKTAPKLTIPPNTGRPVSGAPAAPNAPAGPSASSTAAAPAAPPAAEDPATEESEEAKLISALTLLHQMHTKLTLLRQSIPHMIQPIMKAGTYPSPESLFDEFSKRTLKASEDLVEFTTLVSDGKWVFEKAAGSRKDAAVAAVGADGIVSAGGSAPGEIRRWKSSTAIPAYLKDALDVEVDVKGKGDDKKKKDDEKEKEKEKEKKEKEKQAEAEKEREVEIEEVKGVESDEVRRSILEEFKKENQDFEITDEDDGKKVKIVLPKSLHLTFTVEMPDATAESNRYVVTLPTSSYLHILILRSVTTRPNAGSLKYLLDMISTYKTIYRTKCSKCGKLTSGPKADLPVVRRLKKTVKLVKKDKPGEADSAVDKMDTSSDDKGKQKENAEKEEEEEEIEIVEEHWMSYHEGCVPSPP
ncbi:hypothetical protein ABW19_dt0203743 [Dactylella cylindrospora]|nr:hypothetical protein ABW19_dt0203743 [Dactylella cylindrospora]